jgi:hypothetical protein
MKYHFYGNTTDLYTNVLERTPVLYSKGQLSIKILQKTMTNEWQSYIRRLYTLPTEISQLLPTSLSSDNRFSGLDGNF